MYIMAQNRRSVTDADSVWVEGTGVMCIFADCPPECIASYETENEAIFVIKEIYKHIQKDPMKPYKMPPSIIGKIFPFVNDPEWIGRETAKEEQTL